jgi:hypothetical protein
LVFDENLHSFIRVKDVSNNMLKSKTLVKCTVFLFRAKHLAKGGRSRVRHKAESTSSGVLLGILFNLEVGGDMFA